MAIGDHSRPRVWRTGWAKNAEMYAPGRHGRREWPTTSGCSWDSRYGKNHSASSSRVTAAIWVAVVDQDG